MKKKKSFWGIGLTVTFICFAAGILTLAAYSASSEFDFVSETYYEDSLAYQNVIDAENRAEMLKEKPVISLKNKTLSVSFPENLTVRKGIVEFYSPISSKEDWKVKVNETPISLNSIRSGRWKLTLKWHDENSKEYMIRKNLEIE